MMKEFNLKQFVTVTFIISIWVNISEVFRYFVVVKPYMQNYLVEIDDVAAMDWSIFLIWGIWDTLLTALIVLLLWFCVQVLGNNRRAIFVNTVFSWAFFFVLFWVGLANMNLCEWSFLLLVLPLAFVETFVASWLASRLFKHSTQK